MPARDLEPRSAPGGQTCGNQLSSVHKPKCHPFALLGGERISVIDCAHSPEFLRIV